MSQVKLTPTTWQSKTAMIKLPKETMLPGIIIRRSIENLVRQTKSEADISDQIQLV